MEKLQICSENYKKWKNIALSASNLEEARKAANRAFFWLELHSAFLFLELLEKTKKNDNNLQLKVLKAKSIICKKLVEYSEELLREL
jgi:hypothetical protein